MPRRNPFQVRGIRLLKIHRVYRHHQFVHAIARPRWLGLSQQQPCCNCQALNRRFQIKRYIRRAMSRMVATAIPHPRAPSPVMTGECPAKIPNTISTHHRLAEPFLWQSAQQAVPNIARHLCHSATGNPSLCGMLVIVLPLSLFRFAP